MRRLLTITAALAALAAPGVARADDATTLTVLGTADVKDSGLSVLLKQDFQAAYPGVTFNYSAPPGGSGTAIIQAKAGAGSALIVHAPTLENGFVSDGYSLEPFGRSLFWGDYILAGATTDPAGVLPTGAHDIVTAFEKIATAGAAGDAFFISRGNTAGTVVQEHQLWALTTGVQTCPVTAIGAGGGAAPSTESPCTHTDPSAGGWPYPTWYKAANAGQAANVNVANTCSPAGANPNSCYVFTDRGTFACLNDAGCRGSTSVAFGAPANLKLLTRNNDPAARGGRNALINIFHVYGINPAKFSGGAADAINPDLATKFLNFITSPTEQAKIAQFLSSDDPPFIVAAAPSLTATIPAAATAGTPVTVTGHLANTTPGLPALSGEAVTVSDISGGPSTPVPVASGLTKPNGDYSVSFSPPHSGTYAVTTGSITKLEFPDLSPPFSDILQPTASPSTAVTVTGAFARFEATPFAGGVVLSGSVLPGGGHGTQAAVTLQARPAGSSGDFTKLATLPLAAGDGSFSASAPLNAGDWEVRAGFADPGQIEPATAGSKTVTVPAAASPAPAATVTATPSASPSPSAGPVATLVTISSAKVKKGKLTLKGTLAPAASPSGTVKLLGVATGVLKGKKKVKGGALKTLTTKAVKSGGASFSIAKHLKRNRRWQLQLEYVPSGSAPVAFGAIRSLKVR